VARGDKMSVVLPPGGYVRFHPCPYFCLLFCSQDCSKSTYELILMNIFDGWSPWLGNNRSDCAGDLDLVSYKQASTVRGDGASNSVSSDEFRFI